MTNYENDDIIELGGDIQSAIKYENLLVKIATYIYVEAAHETTTSAWSVYMDEIEELFGLEEGWINEDIASDIEATLHQYFGDFIAESYVVFGKGIDEGEIDRYFDITLFTIFIPGIIVDDCSIEYELQEVSI